tara:strand:+ start:625 stop:873 length:249 start_codon:yes stop_codon:yes gene_type:complete
MKIDTRTENTAYVRIGDWTVYLDNSTGERIIEQWWEPIRIDEQCTICNKLISSENEKLPLEEGACYECKFGPTGDPEDTEER